MPHTTEGVRVLLVDSDPDFLETAASHLEQAAEPLAVETATSVRAGLDTYETGEFDCVVSGEELPDRSGLAFLRAVRERDADIPFVILTSHDEAGATEAVSAGVTDYARKPTSDAQYDILAKRITNAAVGHRARRRTSWLRSVIQNISEGVYVLDSDHRLRFVNFRIATTEGASEDRWRGQHISYLAETGVLSEAEVTRVRRAVDEILGGDAEQVHVTIQPSVPDPDRTLELRLTRIEAADGEALVLGTTRDITAREDRQTELRTIRAQYETLIHHIPDMGVFLFDEDLEYTLAGGAELSEVDLAASEFAGQTPFDLFPDELATELAEHYRAAFEGVENTFEQEYEGSHYRIKTLPVRNDADEIIAGLAVSENITEQKQNQRQLRRQNEQLEAFARAISHDLRNPLTVATGQLELARQSGDSEHLDSVDQALQRSQDLIDDLLALAQSGEQLGDVTEVRLADVARRCWQTVDVSEAGLVIDSDRLLRADESRLRQLIENLVRNAIEHGGTDVTVTVGALSDGFYVADDGDGLGDTDPDSLFEFGYSTNTDGTGYGLAIVSQVADAHGWDVTTTASAAGGARFEITGVDGRVDPDDEETE
ncbi:PAS domain-containing protein [Haloarcula litorea]|uniref:hybrid sensor histidine kinase/response regulator n=1 Tax=Haloarcula litorea TaxID=3032579 RepID=UPI0023E8FC37|nr:PAS domain-containing protein [Halomicroarcula sp. GDY20]